MRLRILGVLVIALAAVTTLSLTRGQDKSPPASQRDARRVSPAEPPRSAVPIVPDRSGGTQTVSPTQISSTTGPARRDFSKLGVLQKEMLFSCQRGADWLYRMNGVKGRFLYGYLPALKSEMEGDHYLRQIGAAFALARSARFLGEKRYAARAAQAILTLLDETVTDSADPRRRHTALPSSVVNRLGAASLLVLAINELPEPRTDLLDMSEQLCNWIRLQARGDGSLRCNDAGEKPDADDVDWVNEYPGLALHALMSSQKHRPAPWKVDLMRKATVYYRGWWKAHRNMAFVPSQTAACVEAYLQTREAPFVEFIGEMNDWLCGLQYDQIDPHRLVWYGGFMSWADGKAVESAPTIGTAGYAESLAEACRAARAATDVSRHQRYTEVLERCLQFVVRLQYTDANAQHFADWYRPRLVGAFHASYQDGDLRIDYAQHALCALVAYLEDVSR